MNKGNEAAYELYNQFLLDVPRLDIFVDGSQYKGDSTSLFMNLWTTFKGNHEELANSNDNSLNSINLIPESFGKLAQGLGWSVSPLNLAWTFFQLRQIGYGGEESLHEESLSPNAKAIRALNYCTQTALASWFRAGRDQWCKQEQDLHLVDGGRQNIEVITAKGNRCITVRKPFRVIKMTEMSDAVELSLVNLTIRFNAETGETLNTWCIQEQSQNRNCNNNGNDDKQAFDTKTLNLDWVLIDSKDILDANRNNNTTTTASC
mmetsp:Transcript_1353/g.2078  ORF Transcript_1353/g.2078 Transcript_1353/m.2078 type:complete len:262 (+) Transcript_1353:330-1115(+)